MQKYLMRMAAEVQSRNKKRHDEASTHGWATFKSQSPKEISWASSLMVSGGTLADTRQSTKLVVTTINTAGLSKLYCPAAAPANPSCRGRRQRR